MLTCITCSKQKDDETGEGARRKEAAKSLTVQIKDIALKLSGSNKGSKTSTPSSFRRGSHRAYPDFDTVSDGVPFPGDRTPAKPSITAAEVVLDEDEAKDWTAQVEHGIQITFESLPQGGNDLKRIRFSRDIYDKWEAQRWWGENFDRIMELYNVQRFNSQALDTPARSDNGRDSSYSTLGSVTRDYGRSFYRPSGAQGYLPPDLQENDGGRHFNAGSSAYGLGRVKAEMSSMDASRTTTSSQDEASISMSNASEMESEWIEEDEPGVYITIRQLADGTRELRRVRFSREKYGEDHAKLWWETNRDRIQAQYL
ncbi:hypothetical protein Leryth_010868 [Lithospermum erythrorhizon]|nr:hypothetical protein Leryth_010868 [Lithospermum erythrorhizon]